MSARRKPCSNRPRRCRQRSPSQTPGIQTFAYDGTGRLSSAPPRNLEEDVQMYEALFCTLLARSGGIVRVPLREVARAGNRLLLYLRPSADRDALELTTGPGPTPTGRPRKPSRRRAS